MNIHMSIMKITIMNKSMRLNKNRKNLNIEKT